MKIINFETHMEKIQKVKGLLLCLFFFLSFGNGAYAQEKNQMVRLAIIKVDPLQIEAYHAALKEQMNAAILKEPGVLTYYAVADKSDPSKITILEIYADTAAYQSHITTAHFQKYKETVKNMVTSLELVDVDLISSLNKSGN
ncbi:putative quinol monooxygenase [Aquiflexum gelatinilyticum]|uniref:putative quinol monooxygenase n=1 Tax=Aquiflexum gelatinilyticum TaxID=2961943 RepID=UPI00216A7716|nr:putative quinol monooxygenase [Aquiflexum gelatinilyticum]MCS4434196.1 antibiotic biosynthesis monooxygenase [Aquiflexum gelatinilyticum]